MNNNTISNTDLSSLKLVKSGKTLKLFYGTDPFKISTEKLYMPFDLKMFENSYSNFPTCSVSCQDKSSEKQFETFFETFDARMRELLKASGVEGDYSPSFKANGDYAKLFKISLSRNNNGVFDFVIFDKDKNKIQPDDENIYTHISKGKYFKAIIYASKVWVYNGNIGVTWNMEQIRLFGQGQGQKQVVRQELEQVCMIED